MTEQRIPLEQLARARDGTGHSIFSASSSAMWMNCPGSLIPNVLAPDEGSFDAAWGTVAHALAEEALRTGVLPLHRIGGNEFIEAGDWGHLIEIDEEMLEHVKRSVDECDMLPGEQRWVETLVSFDHLTPIEGQGGTLDFACVDSDTRTLYVVDHKFGSSPENLVSAERNTQLMLYAIGVLRDDWLSIATINVERVVFKINQPRLDHFDQWECSVEDLIDFEREVQKAAHAAWRYDAPRNPGVKQCRWCKVRGSCAANAKMQDDLIAGVFVDETQTPEQMAEFKAKLDDDITDYAMRSVPIGELSTAQMARLLPFRAMADAWWKSLERELSQRAAGGEKIPGYKIVEGRTRRKFKSDAQAYERLKSIGCGINDLYPPQLVSPAEAEKLLRKRGYKKKQLEELMSELAFKPPGRATLVPLSDKRPEVVDVASLAFTDAESETPEDEEI